MLTEKIRTDNIHLDINLNKILSITMMLTYQILTILMKVKLLLYLKGQVRQRFIIKIIQKIHLDLDLL